MAFFKLAGGAVINADNIHYFFPRGDGYIAQFSDGREFIITKADGEYLMTQIEVHDPKPVVTGISPTTGPAAGGTVVTITGAGLAQVTSVTFAGKAGTKLDATADKVTVTTPPNAPVVSDVVVVGPFASTTAGEFTYQVPPPVKPAPTPTPTPILTPAGTSSPLHAPVNPPFPGHTITPAPTPTAIPNHPDPTPTPTPTFATPGPTPVLDGPGPILP